MRIPSASTDRKVYFIAVDSTDLVTPETGLSAFTVYRSRDGGAATGYTTPTIAEIDDTNMPGLYCLTLDEDTTLSGTHGSEEIALRITCAGMAPVTRVVELCAIVAESVGAAGANKLADHVLRRQLASVASSSDGDAEIGRSLLGAARKLVNKVSIVAGVLTVYKENDSTSAFTQTTTGTAGANPLTAVDTV